MPFIIYPDAATAIGLGQPIGTPVHLGDGEAMRSFVPLAGLVGPDPSEGNAPTTFIRISMLGLPVTADKQPKIELLAHDPSEPNGSPAPPLDPNTAVALAAGVSLFDDVHNPVGAALAYFSPPYLDNVYLLKVAIEIPGTKLWIRISNTTGAARNFVWVVADNDAETRQPWVHATYRDAAPAEITFNASVGQTSAEPAQPIAITNRGTGSLTVSGVNPAIAAPYTMSGLPLTLGPNPNTPATVTVSFDTPSTAGDIPAATFRFITNDNTDPGLFGAGHNNKLILSAHMLASIWAARAPMPTARLGLGLAAASNGKLYAVGGFSRAVGASPFATVEEYDPATNSWVTKAPMPTARIGLGLAAASNGKLYAVGGFSIATDTTFATVEEYDPATNSWAAKTPAPTARTGLGLAAASNGKLYAVGGFSIATDTTFATVEEYDPATNSWAEKAPMPTARHSLGLSAASNGKLYAVGGSNSVTEIATVEEYDPATDTWTGKAPMPTARVSLGLAAASNGKLYAVGGGSADGPAATVEEYDPATNSWATKTPMPTAREDLGLAAAKDGKLYAVGGSAAVTSAVVEEYTP